MTYKISLKSWEKVTHYILSNGWEVCTQYSCYGSYCSSMTSPDGKLWLANNGSPPDRGIGGADKANAIFGTDKYIDLPEFANSWRDDDQHQLVRPNFLNQP